MPHEEPAPAGAPALPPPSRFTVRLTFAESGAARAEEGRALDFGPDDGPLAEALYAALLARLDAAARTPFDPRRSGRIARVFVELTASRKGGGGVKPLGDRRWASFVPRGEGVALALRAFAAFDSASGREGVPA